ncbi:hypothetical protein BHM03_00001967, partial [Ensete ventricosum]
VRMLHSLSHPNVLRFYSWYETSAHLWLVLEYCVGGDILTLLKQVLNKLARYSYQLLRVQHRKGARMTYNLYNKQLGLK